jgi:hypothetical protein
MQLNTENSAFVNNVFMKYTPFIAVSGSCEH